VPDIEIDGSPDRDRAGSASEAEAR
jgi:hypothetical protein